MKRHLSRLSTLFLPLAAAFNGIGQCSFPLTIKTSKDFCLGSSLLLSSGHALGKIVWYRNGLAIDSLMAAQSLDNQGVVAATVTQINNPAFCFDKAGNLYVYDYADYAVKKFAPGSKTGIVVAGGHGKGTAANQLFDVITVCVDDQNNVYAFDASDNYIQKWAPGAGAGVTLTIADEDMFTDYVKGTHAMYVDCSGTIYYADLYGRKVLKWAPGASLPTTAATLRPLQYADQAAYSISVAKDAAGNVFVLDGGSNAVWRYPNGSTNGTLAAGNGQLAYGGNDQNLVDDFWVDADDTVYMIYPYLNKLVRWAPGAMSGTDLLTPNTAFGNSAVAVSRDIKGNFYIGQVSNGLTNIVEYRLTNSIDTTLTPGNTGIYYAVATDVLGHTQTSDTVYINTPQAGAPSISISATATSTPVCTPITFTATTTYPGPNPFYQWDVSGVPAGTNSPIYRYNLFADSDQVYCILTAPLGCTGQLIQDTSNSILLHIDPQGAASVRITANDTTVCIGTPIIFDAQVTNGSAQPVFQWLLDGRPIPGDDTAAYHSDSLRNGDIVTCLITSDDVCGLAKSNSIPVHITAPLTVGPNQTLSIRYGQSITLAPEVTGTVDSWLWTPGATLSDSTIENPMASPPTTTDYKFRITSPGCAADSGYILVDVYTPLSIPNAFTPNGDGHNDVFYVLTGPTGSQIEQLDVFNRWGQIVFQSHGASPGDPSRGWNGYLDGKPAPPDTYIYQVVLRFSDGSRQVYKGTLILIR